MTQSEFSGRVALVTGAAKGIGAATAAQFAQQGASVVLADIDAAAGEATAARIRTDGGRAIFVPVDVRDEGAVAALVARAVDDFGTLDFAVNNAAIRPDQAPLDQMDLADFDALMAINLRSVAACLKHELRQMLRQDNRGAIVNVSSICGLRPQAASPGYVASKSAVIGLTRSASLDYAPQGIRVNCVAPGLVDTPMVDAALPASDAVRQQVAGQLSLFRRFGRAEEVAEACVWLCSDRASLLTGAILPVDGGYTAM